MIRISILHGYGINCDLETISTMETAIKKKNIDNTEIKVKKDHINDLINDSSILQKSELIVIPGGFLHGDAISAGKILANKLRTNLSEEIEQFVKDGKLLLGICNGFQVLAKYPLLPSSNTQKQKISLTYNDLGRFIDKWTYLKVEDSNCIFLKDIDKIHLPIRHAEGKFVASEQILNELEGNNQAPLRYSKSNGEKADREFPYNPNGAIRDIAGVCDETGRILGLMPHPEAFRYSFNEPNWRLKKDQNRSETGRGVKIFENAVEYIKEELK